MPQGKTHGLPYLTERPCSLDDVIAPGGEAKGTKEEKWMGCSVANWSVTQSLRDIGTRMPKVGLSFSSRIKGVGGGAGPQPWQVPVF